MDDVFRDSGQFTAHFFSRSQMQLDSFAEAELKQTEDGGVWLEDGFFLSEQVGTRNCHNDDYEKE